MLLAGWMDEKVRSDGAAEEGGAQPDVNATGMGQLEDDFRRVMNVWWMLVWSE